eukprot:scaffold22828_cov72-Phaeocystis_antarctica.AAC.5
MCVFAVTQISWLRLQTRCRTHAALFPSRRWALVLRPGNTIREAISLDTSSSQHAGHAVRKNCTRSAAGTFSGHRQR